MHPQRSHKSVRRIARSLAVICFAWASTTPAAEVSEDAPSPTAFQWETRSLSETLTAQETSAEAWFLLSNPGPKARRIVTIESDCDCIATAMDKKLLYPGESAALVATFDPGTRVGTVAKSIRVVSRSGDDKPQTDQLTWQLQIESPLTLRRTSPSHDSQQQTYQVKTKTSQPLALHVPPGLKDALTLKTKEAGALWELTADFSKLPSAPNGGPQKPFLLATLPDNQRKHIPIPESGAKPNGT
jgi:hypothetical protein